MLLMAPAGLVIGTLQQWRLIRLPSARNNESHQNATTYECSSAKGHKVGSKSAILTELHVDYGTA